MTEKRVEIWTWIARVVVLLMTLTGIMSAAQQLPVAFRGDATLATTMLGAVSAWIYSFLPGKKKASP